MGLPLRKTSLLPLAVETALFCIGFLLEYEQWGVDYGRAAAKQINYPIAFSKFAKVVAVDGFYDSTRYSKSVLYGEPSLSYFKFTYDAETDFVNWIAIGV